MTEVQLTGGAKIGRANATFPFATLKVNKRRLDLNASIIGNLTFQPSDIISIEPYKMTPILGQGIKINHNVSTYHKQIVFYTFKNPYSLIRQINNTGFFNAKNLSNQSIDKTIIERQKKGGFPLKKSFSIAAIVIWNILFISDIIPFLFNKTETLPIGKGVFAAIGLLYLTAFFSLISSGFRKLILKEGRDLNDIKKFAIFILIISGLMLLQVSFISSMFG